MASKWWQQDVFEEVQAEWQELETPEGLTYFFNNRTGETRWDRPAELMSAEHEAQAGQWLWMNDDIECFVPAKVESQIGQQASLRTQDGRIVNMALRDVALMAPLQWPSLQRIVSDLTLLDDMSAPLILHNLRKRFERDQIYTNIDTILISVNPYRRLELYGPDVIDEYANRGVKDMPPHVFNIAHQALKGIRDTTDNQSVIVSGESGAGKTEATKQVLSYVASVSGSVDNVEEKILLANPILETFGNAKTIRNNNSSRFGRYIEVYINRHGELCASKTINFLLEKVRVAQPALDERNFHIFYQLSESCTEQQRNQLGLGRARDYFYLAQSNCTEVEGIDDAQDFADMLAAMTAIGFTDQERDAILATTAAILHLGNVQFRPTGDRNCTIVSPESLEWAASLLQVDYESLLKVMTTSTLRIQRQADTSVTLGADQAIDARDALAKFIYAAMFDYIVASINSTMTLKQEDMNGIRHIGILDIFGFEVFKSNSFEQLCINYTNENLQQFFNANTFKLEEQLYMNEGIQFDHVEFIDNQPMVDLLTKHPVGIMQLLDDEVRIPRGSDGKFLQKITEQHSSHPNFIVSVGGNTTFAIRHYAGDVVYDTTGFLEKNKDNMTMDQLEVLQKSSCKFVSQLFSSTGRMSAQERKRTLGKQFRTQLDELLKVLYETQPHYIRCIKPNDRKEPQLFVSQMCFEQLTFSGVFEAVQIRKNGFPFRQRHADFIDRYGVIYPERMKDYRRARNPRKACESLLQDLQLNMDNVRMGRSMVLYRSDEFKQIELKRSIMVRKDEIVSDLKELLELDPNSFAASQRERYFERLSKAVRTATEFRLVSPICTQARKLLVHFIESRMDDETRALLEEARTAVDLPMLQQALMRAESNQYNTKLVRECQKLADRLQRIHEEAELACYTLEDTHMRVVCEAAAELGAYSETIDYFNQLLQTTQEERLKVQLKQAIDTGNDGRAIRLTIRTKEMIFTNNGAMFELSRCGVIRSPDEWAGEKLLTLNREKIRTGMLQYSDKDIHSSLTHLGSGKDGNRTAQLLFRSIQACMGVRKSKQPFVEGHSVVALGHRQADMRDEIYVQLLKQLSGNPTPSSVRNGWMLLGACIASFPPNDAFANFLEVWLRNNAQNSDYIGALHNICYNGARQRPIEHAELANGNIPNVLRQRMEEYAEPLPSGPPTYEDLTQAFDPVVDELEFKRRAPKANQRQILPQPQQPQQQQQQQTQPSRLAYEANSGKPSAAGRGGGGGGGYDKWSKGAGVASVKVQQVPELSESGAGSHGRVEARLGVKRVVQARLSAGKSSWQAVFDAESGATYYWNQDTNESSWDPPAELRYGVGDEVKARF